MAQDGARQVIVGIVPHGAVEVDGPGGRGPHGAVHQEGRVGQVEFQVQVGGLAGGDHQGTGQVHVHGGREAAGAAGRMLDLDVRGIHHRTRGQREGGRGIGGGHQGDVPGVGRNGQGGRGVGAGRNLQGADELAELVQLDQVEQGRGLGGRGGGRVDGHRRAAALGGEGNAHDPDADLSPVFGGGVTDAGGHGAGGRRRRIGSTGTGPAAAGQGEGQQTETSRTQEEALFQFGSHEVSIHSAKGRACNFGQRPRAVEVQLERFPGVQTRPCGQPSFNSV